MHFVFIFAFVGTSRLVGILLNDFGLNYLCVKKLAFGVLKDF